MQIAVASNKEGQVDRHFGNTETFSIYESDNGTLNLLKCVEVMPYSSGEKEHDFDQKKFDSIHTVLQGCERLYCTKIGEKPKEELQKRGIEVFDYSGLVKDIDI